MFFKFFSVLLRYVYKLKKMYVFVVVNVFKNITAEQMKM